MPRRYYSGGGGVGWPFMYMQQPGGWAEQTCGLGFGQRPTGRASASVNLNDLFSTPRAGGTDTLSLDTLSALFTRLILQNHLTRLAGDALGLRAGDNGGGGALWGCSVPSPSSSASPCRFHSCSGSGPGNINMCGHTNNVNMACMCHTCPAATRPYMGSNNVFVIPAGQVLQHNSGLGNLNANNNLNMFLSGLGLAMSAAGSGCGGGGGVNFPAAGFTCPSFAGGLGGQVNHNGLGFHCSRCNFQM